MAYDPAFLFSFWLPDYQRKVAALFWLYKTAISISLNLSVTHFHGFVHVASGIPLSLFIWKILIHSLFIILVMSPLGSLSWKTNFLKDLLAHQTICTSILSQLFLWHYVFGSALRENTVSPSTLRNMYSAAAEHSRYLIYTLNSLLLSPLSWN